MDRCPKCGGDSGYVYDSTEIHKMVGTWGGEEQTGDSCIGVSRSLPTCMDCGQRFQWKTIRDENP